MDLVKASFSTVDISVGVLWAAYRENRWMDGNSLGEKIGYLDVLLSQKINKISKPFSLRDTNSKRRI